MRRRVPILMYHQVTPAPVAAFYRYTITPVAFARQMRWLALRRYTPVTMESLVAHFTGAEIPRRPVVITFDDGFRDCVEYAVPILRARGFTATFYLVTGLMGRTSRWMLGTSGVEFPLIDWATARQLEAEGFRCEAHTVSHPALADRTIPECRAELAEARRVLEERLEREVRHLAYPFGSWNQRVRDLAEEAGYRSACTTQKRLAGRGDDRLLLPRVPVYGGDTLVDFVCRLRTAENLGVLRGRLAARMRRFRRRAPRSHR
jgi:peptidoglycan/xylan/chitin deacetylase (PgdA/CDA1 family)